MGYLPPIQFTQYQDYQNRIKGIKSNYSETVRINRVKRVYLSQIKNRGTMMKQKQNKENEKGTNQAYADLTGIGGQFDEKM